MTDQTDTQSLEDQQGGNAAENWRKKVEGERDSAKAEADAAKAEADALKRQLAFSKTGLDGTNGQHQFFMENYKGEASEEAIIEAAKKFGFLQEPPNPQQQNIDANTRMDNASFNAEPSAVNTQQEALVKDILAKSASGGEFDWNAAQSAGLVATG